MRIKNNLVFPFIFVISCSLNNRNDRWITSNERLKNIKYHTLDDSTCSYEREKSMFLIGKDTILLKYSTSNDLMEIIINGLRVDKILSGNEPYEYEFSEFRIEEKNFKWFEILDTKYFLIPASFKNCTGSFCRATAYFLIEKGINGYNIFFFLNQDVPIDFYFRLYDENKLAYITQNSFSLDEQLLKKYSLKHCDNCFECIPLVNSNTKWNPVMEQSFIIMYYENFKKTKIIKQ